MRSLFFRSPSKPKLTGLGWTVILIALASGAAAINTGNNLLYLCWGFILSAVVISGFLSEFNLMNLSLGRQNTPQARVRETCWFPLVMNNRSRFFPAFGVCAELTLELMGKKITAWGEPILSLPAQHQKEMLVEFSPTRRGKAALSEATVATQYPFGFFEKSRTETLDADAFCVFPERMDVRQWVTRLIRAMGENPAAQRGMGDEFFSLKNFEEGDDPRKIAWRRSAKVGRFFVKENEASQGGSIWLVLSSEGLRPKFADDFATEKAIAFTASLAEGLIDHGHRVGLCIPGQFLKPGNTPAHRQDILEALALMDDENAELTLPPERQLQITIRRVDKPTALQPVAMDIL